MAHVQVVERFVEQDVIGVLAQHHGDVGALALAAGQLVQVPVLQRGGEVEELDGAGDDVLVPLGDPSLRVGGKRPKPTSWRTVSRVTKWFS